MRIKQARKELVKDILFIVLGAIFALILSKLGIIDFIVNLIGNRIISSFLAGLFFTSVFTIAPAAVAFVNISDFSITTIAFWGGLGALCGDLILFYFIRDRFTENLMSSMRASVIKNILNSFHLGFMRWLSPILGAIIIASPLPDELGLTLLGLSKTKIAVLIPISFVMNYLGIVALLLFSKII